MDTVGLEAMRAATYPEEPQEEYILLIFRRQVFGVFVISFSVIYRRSLSDLSRWGSTLQRGEAGKGEEVVEGERERERRGEMRDNT